MASTSVDKPQSEEVTTVTTKSSKLIPLNRGPAAKNAIFFPALLVALQAIFIILLSLHGEYGHEPTRTNLPASIRSTVTYINGTIVYVKQEDPSQHRGIADLYSMFQDIHVMMFVGFGFLMTFLRKYGFSAVGYNFLVAAFVLEWALIVRGYMFDFNAVTRKFPIDVERIIVADFVAAAVLISFGAVLGKTNPTQLLVMAFIEVLLQSANEFLGLRRFCAYDIGESMFVHVFGAYFGLAVAFMLYNKKIIGHPSTRTRKICLSFGYFAMIGTLFLFCYWPSFNAGVAVSGDTRLRAVVNTYISIASSVLLTYVCSCIFSEEKKLDMVHIQNATLAGGVAVGTIADKIILPAGAMIVGSVAGTLSTVGFRFIKPILQKFRVHDTCGVNNLHGMPGLLAGIFGIILAIFPTYSLYTDNLLGTCWHGENRTYLGQIGYQALALGVTIGIAVLGGLLTGVILRLPLFNDDTPASYFNDEQHWEMPADFYSDATPLIPDSAQEQIA